MEDPHTPPEIPQNLNWAPWGKFDLLPRAPIGVGFGYVTVRGFTPCSRDELMKVVSQPGKQPVNLVWTPAAPRVVPACEVPFLQPIVRRREMSMKKKALRNAAAMSVFFGSALAILLFTGLTTGVTLWLGVFFMIFGIIPFIRSLTEVIRLRRRTGGDFKSEGLFVRYSLWILTQQAPDIFILGVPWIVVLVLQMAVGMERSIDLAALVGSEVRSGELQLLLTSALLHGNIIHLFFNFNALLVIGRLVCALGNRYYLYFVFVVSAITGGLFSTFLPPHVPSVGASGGLLGCLGFLLVFAYRHRSVLPADFVRALIESLCWLAMIGVIGYKFIDNAGHLGGFVGGAVIGLILVPRCNRQIPLEAGFAVRTGALIGIGLLALAFIYVVYAFGAVLLTGNYAG